MKSFHCHKFFYSLKLGIVFVCQQRALWLSSRPCAWSSTWSPSARRLGGSPGTWWALTSGIRRSTACAKSSRFVLVTLGSYSCPNKQIQSFGNEIYDVCPAADHSRYMMKLSFVHTESAESSSPQTGKGNRTVTFYRVDVTVSSDPVANLKTSHVT